MHPKVGQRDFLTERQNSGYISGKSKGREKLEKHKWEADYAPDGVSN